MFNFMKPPQCSTPACQKNPYPALMTGCNSHMMAHACVTNAPYATFAITISNLEPVTTLSYLA